MIGNGHVYQYAALMDWAFNTNFTVLSTDNYNASQGALYDGTHYYNVSGSGSVQQFDNVTDWANLRNFTVLSFGNYPTSQNAMAVITADEVGVDALPTVGLAAIGLFAVSRALRRRRIADPRSGRNHSSRSA